MGLNGATEFAKNFCKKLGAEYIAAVRFRLGPPVSKRLFSGLRVKTVKCRRAATVGLRWTSPGEPCTEYNFVLSDGMVVPDPASRAQKTDVNGPSYVVDPGSAAWRNTGWER